MIKFHNGQIQGPQNAVPLNPYLNISFKEVKKYVNSFNLDNLKFCYFSSTS